MWNSKRNLALVTAIALFIAALGIPALSQQAAEPSPEEMQKMLEQWLKTINPGPSHEKLDYFVGQWETVTKVFWAGPDGPASETKGTATTKWILGKRHLESSVHSKMMMPDAKTGEAKEVDMEGRSTLGFDAARNLYVGTWMDTLSTGLVTFKGTAAPDGKSFRFYGEMDEPMLNMYGRTVKFAYTIKDKNTFVFEIIDLAAGDNYKVVEVTYTRKK